MQSFHSLPIWALVCFSLGVGKSLSIQSVLPACACRVQVEQISRERDKMKLDLEKAKKRNLQLVKEVDDHHSAIEHRNENKLKYGGEGLGPPRNG